MDLLKSVAWLKAGETYRFRYAEQSRSENLLALRRSSGERKPHWLRSALLQATMFIVHIVKLVRRAATQISYVFPDCKASFVWKSFPLYSIVCIRVSPSKRRITASGFSANRALNSVCLTSLWVSNVDIWNAYLLVAPTVTFSHTLLSSISCNVSSSFWAFQERHLPTLPVLNGMLHGSDGSPNWSIGMRRTSVISPEWLYGHSAGIPNAAEKRAKTTRKDENILTFARTFQRENGEARRKCGEEDGAISNKSKDARDEDSMLRSSICKARQRFMNVWSARDWK